MDIHGRILVVDDYAVNRMQLKYSLEQQGHTIAVAENGRQALEMLDGGAFDLVLLDILMPEMDGFDVLRCLKSNPALRDLPVIVISALEEMDSGYATRGARLSASNMTPAQGVPAVYAITRAVLRRIFATETPL